MVEQKALSTHRVLVHLGLVRSPDKIHNDLGDLLLINASRLLPFPVSYRYLLSIQRQIYSANSAVVPSGEGGG